MPDPLAYRKPRSRTAELKPMATDRLSIDTTRIQLISPPPEETLRRVSGPPFTPSLLAGNNDDPTPSNTKRKRNATPKAAAKVASGDAAATPNPRLRKQIRRDNNGEDVDMARRDNNNDDVDMASPTRSTFNTSPSKSLVLQSPHLKNPNADYIPPLHTEEEEEEEGRNDVVELASAVRRKLLAAKSTRRSATPIPSYEPPKDVFTPPRQVVLRAAAIPPSTRRRHAKSALGRGVVKLEMPVIDLTVPMPPPSPTDDPLLLSSDIEEMEALPPPLVVKTPRAKTKRAGVKRTGTTTGKGRRTPGSTGKTVELRSTSTAEAAKVVLHEEMDALSSPPKRLLDFDLPPSSPPPSEQDGDGESEGNYDWTQNPTMPMESTEDSLVMHLDSDDERVAPVALFDFDAALLQPDQVASGGWSDSEDEDNDNDSGPANGKRNGGEVEGRGDYTGRYRMMRVRTKTDPPSEATAGRMEEWGRPVSPFPGVKRLRVDGRDEEVDLTSTPTLASGVEESVPVAAAEEAHVDEVRGVEEKESEKVDEEDEDSREEEEVVRMSIEPEEDVEHPLQDTPQTPAAAFTPARTPARRILVEEEASVLQERRRFDFGAVRTPARRVLVEENPVGGSVDGEEGVGNGDGDDEDDLSDMEEDFSMVKIVSADPRAAARAAAILKQYDYECFTKLSMKQRKMDVEKKKRRYSSVDGLSRGAWRGSILHSGGVSKKDAAKRRRTTMGMGVVGERVVIPGSPSVTLPELLSQVEREVGLTPGRGGGDAKRVVRDPFKTPATAVRVNVAHASSSRPVYPFPAWSGGRAREREWTREEWKWLDSCLTDERMEGAEMEALRPVDEVDVEAVVERFVGLVGGEAVVKAYGAAWTRDSLRQRVHALQRKQRAGNVAPPTTPTPAATPAPLALGGERRVPGMEVPDFTPLGRRAMPPRRVSRGSLGPASSALAGTETTTPFSSLRDRLRDSGRRNRDSGIAPYLLAPRYSHLMDEARVVSKEVEGLSMHKDVDVEQEGVEAEVEEDTVDAEEEEEGPSMDLDASLILETPQPHYPTPETPSTLGTKLKGIFFSYMPTLATSKTAPQPPRLPSRQPGLPLPPPSVLNKKRGNVRTPARPPVPKAKAPKELVELAHVDVVKGDGKRSGIPTRVREPKRLVNLNPVPLPVTTTTGKEGGARPRRSSGSSVKDLVKGFEELKKVEEERERERQRGMGRSKSSLGMRSGVVGGAGSLMHLSRPGWRP